MSSSESAGDDSQSVLDVFEDWYHVPALALILGIMLRIRLSSYDNFIRGGEVFFSGNDPWYHFRETAYVVQNWPFTMPFDPWTGFPVGNASGGQFGSLYDQLVATAALLLGLGDPSTTLIGKTLLVAPAVFGALAVVPVYFIGKRFGGRPAGLFGAVVLMLIPGTFLSRTLAGVADHNAAEPFFQAIAVVAVLVALAVAEREKPVWELVQARDWESLQKPAIWGAIAGAAIAIYMWVWPPGILLVGIFGAFLLLKLSSDVYNEKSPEPIALVSAVAMSVTALLMVIQVDVLEISTTTLSLLHPLFALLVGVGTLFLAGLARLWEQREIDCNYYPFAVLGLLVFSLLLSNLVLPSLYATIENNFFRILAFSANAATRTIAEAQPFLSASIRRGLSPTGMILSEYGFAFFTAVAAAVWMLAKPLVEDGDREHLAVLGGGLAIIAIIFAFPVVHTEIANLIGMDQQVFALFVVAAIIAIAAHVSAHDATNLFVITWAAFITAAAFTQVRFNYYLAVVVAVLNAYLIAELLAYLDIDAAIETLDDIEAYQVISIALAAMLILMPVLIVPIGLGPQGSASSQTSWEAAQGNGPGAVTQWDGSLDWLSNETPSEGNYAGAGNTERMQYYGTYERTDDFSYPEGAYGVMSWWDYGHWITVEGERVPNANPFQQGATNAANYLLAPNTTQAQSVLDERAEDGETTRYVMVDWQMVSTNSKFGAPVTFYDAENVSRSDFYTPMYQSSNGRIQQLGFNVREQRYYESQMVRLYMGHGSAMEPQPIVTDWRMTQVPTQDGGSTFIRTVPQDGQVIKQFQSMDAARQYVQEDATFEGEPTSQVGGLDKYPSERVEAMEHYRLVKAAESTQQFTVTQENYPYVKTFEKVPGATVEGSGAPENTTVQASVEMRVPSTNSTFTYTQQTQTDENGEFTMTMPYSTTGYEEFGPENGYTNVSVRATGQYSFSTTPQVGANNTIVSYQSQADVSEAQVVGAEEGPVEVTLERNERNFSLQRDSSNSSDTSANGLAGEHLNSGSSTVTTDSPDGALSTADTVEARTADA